MGRYYFLMGIILQGVGVWMCGIVGGMRPRSPTRAQGVPVGGGDAAPLRLTPSPVTFRNHNPGRDIPVFCYVIT